MTDSHTVQVIVEIPKGSRNKYEIDHATGAVMLDRVLYSSVHYPTDYGFVPGTHAADGDPLDVLIITAEPTFPGCHVVVRIIGLLRMRDEKGVDEKLLAVPVADPRSEGLRDLSDVNRHLLVEIKNFFETYKELEGGKTTHVEDWRGASDAWDVLMRYATERMEDGPRLPHERDAGQSA